MSFSKLNILSLNSFSILISIFGSNLNSIENCYLSPSCTATEAYDKITGFTNDTG